MPELPDLEIISHNLKDRLAGKTVINADIYRKGKNASAEQLQSGIIGQSLSNVRRVGKEILFEFANDVQVGFHLMLNGTLDLQQQGGQPENVRENSEGQAVDQAVKETENRLKEIKNKVASLHFSDGTDLILSDLQGLSKVCVNPEEGKAPDALSPDFTWEYFLAAIKKHARMNVKTFLMKQEILRGIGSAYADEILYAAGISPESKVGFIPETELELLHRTIPEVLKNAVFEIRRITPDRISGEERSFLKVHNPDLAVTEDGDTILVKEIASRKTYYTEKQELFI